MNILEHRAKAERIERSLRGLTTADYEAVIEGTMLAGTHWFNLLLHQKQLLPEHADAMHAEFMSMGARRRVLLSMPRALAALDLIEALRTTHVRGDMVGGVEAAEQALEALGVLRTEAVADTNDHGTARP